MLMPNRTYTAPNADYSFGFNGKEMDNEVSGEGNQYDYGFRIYNSRIGKFLSVDPLFKSYPWYTPYQFAGNKPIRFIDLDGLEEADPKKEEEGFWYGFASELTNMTWDLLSYIANNPNHAGYDIGAKAPPTQEQFSIYSVDWSQQLDPYYQIEQFSEGLVNTVWGVYEFGEGIYEGDGRKTARALPSVLSAVGTIYGASTYINGFKTFKPNKIGVKKSLNGEFKTVNESMSDASKSYQSYVTGKPWNQNYVITNPVTGKPVKFDGYSNGILLDAKSGMSNFVNKQGEFYDWFNGKQGLLDQARRQLQAADGNRIRWTFENEDVMNATKTLFEENGIEGIELMHVPKD